MARALRVFLFVATAILAGGCGDDGEASLGADSGHRDRAGHLDIADSTAFNRAIADYNGAAVHWQAATPTCQVETKRMLERDARPVAVFRCHRELTDDVVGAVDGLQGVVAGLDGEWTSRCHHEVAGLRTFLDRFDAAWRAVQRDWNLLSADRRSTLDKHVVNARDMAIAFARHRLPAMHDACLIPEDVAKGRHMAEEAAAAAADG